MPPHRSAILAASAAVIALVLAAVFIPHFHRETGLTSLIRFGGLRQDKLAPELAGVPVYQVPGHRGYDGRYYAHMALHPPWIYHDLASHYDAPAYRLRRVLLPVFAWAAGGGNPAWVVQIYALSNVLAWLALAWLLTRWLPLVSWENFGRWCGCVLAAGALESVRASLPDLPALLLALAGLWWWWDGRRSAETVAGAGMFAASVLTRETMVLSVGGLLWPQPFSVQNCARAALLGALIILPTALWVLYVAHYFPGSSSGGAAGNFSWPFAALFRGAADAIAHLARGREDNGRYTFRLVTILSLGLQMWVVLTGWRREPRWLRFSWLFMVLFPVLGRRCGKGLGPSGVANCR